MTSVRSTQQPGPVAGLLRYAGVGSLGTVLDVSLFLGLVQVLRVAPGWANILSTGTSMTISFVLNHRFVFASRRGLRETAWQYFLATVFSGWVVQSAVIAGLLRVLGHGALSADHAGWATLLAKAGGVAAGFVCNFVTYRFIFATGRASRPGRPDGDTVDR